MYCNICLDFSEYTKHLMAINPRISPSFNPVAAIDQAFRSMHELDPLLYSILKQTCQVVGGQGARFAAQPGRN